MPAIQPKILLAALATLWASTLLGCTQSGYNDYPEELPPELDGPGSQDWSSTKVACQTTSDCALHEACIDNVCQMPRCQDGPYTSTPPIGTDHQFLFDREILSADSTTYNGDYWVDGYLPQQSSITYASASYDFGAAQIVDVTGGNLLGTRPETAAAAIQGSSTVKVWNGSQNQSLSVGFQPVALAAGDVDGDSVDEVVALSANGKIAICHATSGQCEPHALSGSIVGQDVAAADVDGDGYAEPIFLVKDNGHTKIEVWNPNHADTGEPEFVTKDPGTDYLSLEAGDLDGDGTAEIVALEDGGWLGLSKDHVHIWQESASGLAEIGSVSVDADSKDITVADLDMDQRDEIVDLHNTRTVDVYHTSGAPTALTMVYSGDLSASSNPQRIAAADIDGDSPSATLVDGPQLVAGPPVPTSVLNFPPYSKSHSSEPSYLFVGDTSIQSESYTDSVSLQVGFEVGVDAKLAGIFSASVKAHLSKALSASKTFTKSYAVGPRFTIKPQPELHGPNYGVVTLSSGCYHSYTYRLDDPTGHMGQGADGGEFVVVVPVGGQTTTWSTTRYNAMAQAVGGLPIVTTNHQIGDPTSYPASPEHADGTPVASQDMVFPQPPKFLVSDVGNVGWWLAAQRTQTNDVTMTTNVGVSSSVSVAGFSFSADVTGGIGKGYSITVGNEVLFGGGVPAIPDDPNTPEDEYKAYAFSFAPYVYQEHYQDNGGANQSYYVLDFVVGKQQ